MNSNSIASFFFFFSFSRKKEVAQQQRNLEICPHVAIGASHFVRIPSGQVILRSGSLSLHGRENALSSALPPSGVCEDSWKGPGPRHIMFIRPPRESNATQPGVPRTYDRNRYSIQKTLGSLEFSAEQWPCSFSRLNRNGATYFNTVTNVGSVAAI